MTQPMATTLQKISLNFWSTIIYLSKTSYRNSLFWINEIKFGRNTFMSWKKVRKFRQGIHPLNQGFLSLVPIHTVQDTSSRSYSVHRWLHSNILGLSLQILISTRPTSFPGSAIKFISRQCQLLPGWQDPLPTPPYWEALLSVKRNRQWFCFYIKLTSSRKHVIYPCLHIWFPRWSFWSLQTHSA